MYPSDILIVPIGLLIVGIILTTVYTFIVRVPFVPTSQLVTKAMISLARLEGGERVFDLGAGDARILIEAKRQFPSIIATGAELVPTVWLLGRWKISRSKYDIALLRRNSFTVDVRAADALFLYLSSGMMEKLEKKFERELRPGTVIISHSFPFVRKQPEETVNIRQWGGAQVLYRYVW